MIKRKISIALCALFFLCGIHAMPAMAANNVSNIDMVVALQKDGSATITQTWTGDFEEGTECYLPVQHLGNRTIKNFSVHDAKGAFRYVDDWDVNAGLEEKKGTCGIVKTDEGYELCFGIGSYGHNTYTFQYTVTDLVQGYHEQDGFNYQFVNSGMGTLPTKVSIVVKMADGTAINDNNTDIWAFGFEGNIHFQQDGLVYASTTKPLANKEESVIIMMGFHKGLFSPQVTNDKDFSEVKEKAFKGSTYDTEDDSGSLGVTILVFLAFFAAAVWLVLKMVFSIRRRMQLKEFYQNAHYFREAPIGGNMGAVFVMGRDFSQIKEDDAIITAMFLRLIVNGNLEAMVEKSVGFMGREKENISLKLVSMPDKAAPYEQKFYQILVKASGEDHILQEKELEKYCKSHYQSVQSVVENAKEEGINTLSEMNCYTGKSNRSLKGLTQIGKDMLGQIVGFKKYLLEFSLIKERSVNEVLIWQDCLVFAGLLGIADQVKDEFKKMYPGDLYPNVPNANDLNYYLFLSMRYNYASFHAAEAAAQAARSAGSGGSSSFGGGGGFSGGGVGGGTR